MINKWILKICIYTFFHINGRHPLQLIYMHLNQMNLGRFMMLLKNQNQTILGNFNRLAILLCNMLVTNSIDQNPCFSIDVHLVILNAKAHD